METLILLCLKQLQLKRAKRALMVIFDSSFPFSVGERRLLRRADPFTLLTFDFCGIPSIMEERASTYQALFFESLQIEASSRTGGPLPRSGSVTLTPGGRTT